MLKKYFTSFLLFLFFATSVLSQNAGDYRAINSGNWTTLSTWQYWDGDSWENVTAVQGYPGQNGNSGQVTISSPFSVELGIDILYNISGIVMDGGELVFLNNGEINLNTSSIVLINGAVLRWDQQANVVLPDDAFVAVYDGSLITTKPQNCSESASLVIGDEVITSCKGNNGTIGSFTDFVDQGGLRRTVLTNRNKTFRVNKN